MIANNTRNYILLIEGSGSLSATPIDPLSANGAIPTAEAISDRERLISQFEDSLFEVTNLFIYYCL